MKPIDVNPKVHLFICCRHRDEKGCCSTKGAEDIVKELKSWVQAKGLKPTVKVSKSSCLGYCESGITACIYPQNQWFHELTATDVEPLKKMLEDYAE